MESMPELECACASVRRTARLITQLYSEEMGSLIEPAQFALLSAIHRLPGSPQTRIAGALGFDKTTMSRNLSVLSKRRWIEDLPKVSGADQRQRSFRLTASGRNVLAEATPGWKRAQSRLRKAVGDATWTDLRKVLTEVARVTGGLLTPAK